MSNAICSAAARNFTRLNYYPKTRHLKKISVLHYFNIILIPIFIMFKLPDKHTKSRYHPNVMYHNIPFVNDRTVYLFFHNHPCKEVS